MSKQDNHDIEVLRQESGTVWYEANMLDVDVKSSMFLTFLFTDEL
jgi:hypothetical protein